MGVLACWAVTSRKVADAVGCRTAGTRAVRADGGYTGSRVEICLAALALAPCAGVPTTKPRRVMRGRWRRASPAGERLSAC